MKKDSAGLVTHKDCYECLQELPIASFGRNKYTSTGYYNICLECRSEALKDKRRKKYGPLKYNKPEPEIIRGVKRQNTRIIDLLWSQNRVECIGYQVRTGALYKVIFGDAKYLNHSICLIKEDGQIFRILEFSGGDPEIAKAQILALLKIEGLRLELDEASLLAAKALIYYL